MANRTFKHLFSRDGHCGYSSYNCYYTL